MIPTEILERLVTVVRPTHAGTELIVGHTVAPIMAEEIEGREVVTAVSVEGAVVETRITGLPMPIEEEAELELLHLLPIESVKFH